MVEKKLLFQVLRFLVIFTFLSANVFADSHHPQEFLKSVAGSKTEGQEIVKHYCALCHADNSLIQLGAPKIGSLTDWQPRLKQGMQKLFEHTSQGFNAMPARGGCFECTDEQLMLAIVAMLPKKDAK